MKTRGIPGWLAGVVGALALVGAWWLLSVTAFDPPPGTTYTPVPSPLAVLRTVVNDGPGFYWSFFQVTLTEAAWGFFWGNLAALLLASTVLVLPRIEAVVTQIAVVSYCLPLVAVGGISIVVVGGADRPGEPSSTAIFLAALSVFFTTVVGALLGFKAAEAAALDVVRVYGGSRFTQLRKVRLIAALPAILNALQIAVPSAFLGAVLGEYMGSIDRSVGTQLIALQGALDSERVWAIFLLCAAVALLGYAALGLLARLVTPVGRGEGRMSAELVAERRDRVRRGTTRALARAFAGALARTVQTVAIVLVGWYLLWFWAVDTGRISGYVAKGPLEVFAHLFVTDPDAARTAADNRDAVMPLLSVTLTDAGLGFVVGMTIAVVLAMAFTLSKTVEAGVMPLALLLRSIPLVSIAPVVILITGRGTQASVAVIGTIVVLFPALASVLFGLSQANRQSIDLVHVYGGGNLAALVKVAIPGALPSLFAAARVSVPGAVTGALLAEWLSTGKGIGGNILKFNSAAQFDNLWACVALITLITLVLYNLVQMIESLVLAEMGMTDRA